MWSKWPFHVLLVGMKKNMQPLWKRAVSYRVKYAFTPTVVARTQDGPTDPPTVNGADAVINRLSGKNR